MRRFLLVGLAAVMLFALAVPAMAVEVCPETPWCGEAKSMGYWKNDGVDSNNFWMETSMTFGSPRGDYKQIFINQAIAFHNNYLTNACCEGVRFQQTYYKGSCGSMISMHDIDDKVHAILENDFNGYSKYEVEKLKDVLDNINNNKNIYVYGM